MKQIIKLNEIYNSITSKFLVNNLIDLDLSNLDLTKIKEKAWASLGQIDNVNFSNCKLGINFYNGISKYFIYPKNCIFINTTFNIIDYIDGYSLKFIDCNLCDSNIFDFINNIKKHIYIDFINCTTNKEFINNYNINCDYATLIKSKIIYPNSLDLFKKINYYYDELYKKNELDINDIKDTLKLIKRSDQEHLIIDLIEELFPYLDTSKKFDFFEGEINSTEFNNILFNKISRKHLSLLSIRFCTFNNCIFNNELINYSNDYYSYNYECTFNNCSFPKFNEHSWTSIGKHRLLMDSSPYTIRTNLYVELGRLCNAKCKFCRNSSYDNCTYNKKELLRTLKSVLPYCHDIVIGGGEPTLVFEDILECKNLDEEFSNKNWYVFTNGSLSNEQIKILLENGFKINLSRHSYMDEENNKIFNINNSKFNIDIEKFNSEHVNNNTTLCVTCFKGGIDNENKVMDYFTWAIKKNFNSILFSNLHEDNSSGINTSYENLNVESSIFQELQYYLLENGYTKKTDIYSTGSYISTVYKKDNISIIFKKYLSKKEFKESWDTSIKKTYDLSIDPSGTLHENWHQLDNGYTLKKK